MPSMFKPLYLLARVNTPATLTRGLQQTGMPLGLQRIAPVLEAERLLCTACWRWCEAALNVTFALPLQHYQTRIPGTLREVLRTR